MAKKLKSYKFELGNTNTGSLGLVIRVQAKSVKRALRLANRRLSFFESVDVGPEKCEGVEYCNVYLAPNLTRHNLVRGETEKVWPEDEIRKR